MINPCRLGPELQVEASDGSDSLPLERVKLRKMSLGEAPGGLPDICEGRRRVRMEAEKSEKL